MRVNIYAEEMTDRIEIIEKEIDGNKFEAIRFYMYLPTTIHQGTSMEQNVQGPFIHREGDDDSAAVTFWSRGKLRQILQKAIDVLDEHHTKKRSDPLRNNPVVGFMTEAQAERILAEMREEERG